MLIHTKEAFATFADQFRAELLSATEIVIKPSKMRETLSLAAGFKSHNNLLNGLPVHAGMWLQQDACERLQDLIKSVHGKVIVAHPLIVRSVEHFDFTQTSTALVMPIKPKDGKFKPATRQDFLTVAKSLESFLSLKSDQAKLILAQIYGHASVDETYRFIESSVPVGPYDIFEYRRFYDEHDEKIAYDIQGENRLSRVYSVLQNFFKMESYNLPKRCGVVTDMDLFNPIDIHLSTFERLSTTFEILDGKNDGINNSIDDYAYLKEHEETGEIILCLTNLGKSVFEAASSILDDLENQNQKWPEILYDVEHRLRSVIDAHPENPWPKAMFVAGLSRYYYQGGWDENLGQRSPNLRGFNADASPLFKKHVFSNALMFSDFAEVGLKQFFSLLGDKKDQVADHKFITHNAETFYYPALLFYAGMNALNRRDYNTAYKWLSLNYKVTRSDNFGARYYLAALALLRGKGAMKSYVKYPEKDYIDCWGALCLAIQEFQQGNTDSAKKYFKVAFAENFGALEIFSKPLIGRLNILICANDNAPAAMQHLHYLLTPFWEKNPQALSFFQSLSKPIAVAKALCEYHIAKSNTFGSALRSELSKPCQLEQDLALASLALDQVVHKYWAKL